MAEHSGRDLPQPAQAHRRPVDARRPRRTPRAADQPGARRARAAARSPTSTRSSTATSTTRCTARRAARRRSSSRSAPGWSSSSRRRSGVDVIRAHEEALPAPRGRARGRPSRPSRSSATSTPSGCRSSRSSSARRSGPLPAPQLRRRAAQRPVRHPVARRLLVRRPVRAPAARHRPRAVARVRARDRRAAARASSRAGCGSTSTTSSPRPCSTTSSRPSRWSPEHGWRLLGDYRFDAGHRAVAPPRRPGRAADAAGPGRPTTPTGHDALPAPRRPGAGVGAGRLPRGGAEVCSPDRHSRLAGRRRRPVSDDFEHLRWFELPARCLTPAGG